MENKTETLVESVRDLGVQFQPNDVDITGQDGATSIVLPDEGRSIWIFGDSVEGEFDDVVHLELAGVLSNTASIIPDQDASDGIKKFEYLKDESGKRARQLILFDDDEPPANWRLWAIHGVIVNDLIYLFYHKIELLPEITVFQSFALHGMGIARAKVGEYLFERLRAPDGTREFWKPEEPSYGVFTNEIGDGYVYIWGALKNEGRDGLGSDMYLTRVPKDSIDDLTKYEYLVNAPTLDSPDKECVWGKSFSSTGWLFGDVPNEMSCSLNKYLGKYIAFHTIGVQNKLAIRTADKITGPWSEPEIIHRPQGRKPKTQFNALKEHPELARENGRILYATYVDTDDYLPRLIEVKLKEKF